MAHIFMRQTCLFYLGIGVQGVQAGVPVFPGDDHVVAQKQVIVKFRWSPSHSQNQMFAGMSTKKGNLNEQIRIINGNHNVFKFSSKAIDIEVLVMSWFRESIHTGESWFKKPHFFLFFNRELFELRKIYVLKSKNWLLQKNLFNVGEFASWNLS